MSSISDGVSSTIKIVVSLAEIGAEVVNDIAINPWNKSVLGWEYGSFNDADAERQSLADPTV